MKKCIDCGKDLTSRRKSAKRCIDCRKKHLHENKKGRTLPFCKCCNNKLSVIKNKTGLCKRCGSKEFVPWNRGMKGLIPWNKGKSIFKNKEEYKFHVNKNRKEKRIFQTVQSKLADRIRTLIRNQIKKYSERKKNTKTEILLGCNCNFFKDYLENMFSDGMDWNNYGNGHNKWNIDHIIPVSSFDLSNVEQQKKAFHFTNCRPMWSIDNIKKGNKTISQY